MSSLGLEVCPGILELVSKWQPDAGSSISLGAWRLSSIHGSVSVCRPSRPYKAQVSALAILTASVQAGIIAPEVSFPHISLCLQCVVERHSISLTINIGCDVCLGGLKLTQ